MILPSTNSIGKPVSRVEGPAKVTGQAKYAAEFNVPGLAHGLVVSSKIAKGRIKSINRSAALAVPGVIEVFAHDNRPSVALSHEKYSDEAASPGSPFRPFYDDQILFSGQPIALVVAEEFEIARFAATLVDIEYEVDDAITDVDTQLDKAFSPPKKRLPGWDPPPRGDADKALSRAPIHIRHEYRTPIEHHNPMENFGSTAVWDGDGRLTVYDKTQGAPNCHKYLCNVFGLAKDKVRVLSRANAAPHGPRRRIDWGSLAARSCSSRREAPSSAHVRGQGDFLYAARRRRAGRQACRVLPLCRLQSVVRPRG